MSTVTVALGCHPGDQHQAIRLFDWIAELGRCRAPLLLIASDECDIPELMRHANMAFDSVVLELDTEKVKSDWSAPEAGPKSAAGPNSLWKKAAWNFYLPKLKGPWMWLEPDGVPLCRDWFDILVAEYRQHQKPFMGALIQSPNRLNDQHMSGTGIYDPRTPEIMVQAMRADAVAFDVADAVKVLENAHITSRIVDRYRPPPFTSMADVTARIPDGAVLYHSNKDGSLIPFMRQKLGMSRPEFDHLQRPSPFYDSTWATTASTSMAVAPPAATPVVDIYLKTYPKDYELANYCLKSIAKFVTGYRSIIVEAPEFERFGHPHVVAEVAVCVERAPGYIDQQAKKLAAFKHTDADYLLMVDSDCCFQQPFDVSEMFKDGRSTWQYTPFTDARDDQKSAWQPVMEKFLGKPSPNEFMRRHPHILPRWLPEEMDKFCRYRHGKTLDEYIMAQADPQQPLALAFSEFNCAGFFAWEFFRDRIAWVTDAEATPAPCLQSFTHGGEQRIKDDIEQFKRILGEDHPKVMFGERLVIPEQPIEFNVEGAMAVLAAEASQSPGHKGRLIRKFNSVMATVKPKMPEGFGKGRKQKKLKGGDATCATSTSSRELASVSETHEAGKLRQNLQPARSTVASEGAVKSDPSSAPFILAVQTYPGANDTLQRHAPFFERAGASRIVAITTTDGKCTVPKGWEEVQIGRDSYIDGDVLPRRVLHILEWFVTQPEHLLCCAEYDNILRPIKPWAGMMLAPAGGKLPNSKASTFFHTPWFIDRESAKEMIPNMQEIIAVGITGPEASPDVFLSYAVDRSGPLGFRLAYKPFEMFTRNTIGPEDLEDARQAYRKGLHIHGCKDANTLKYITS